MIADAATRSTSGRAVAALRAMVPALAGLAVTLLMLAAFGLPPWTVTVEFFRAALGSSGRIAATLLVACPLLVTGLAVCVAFRCGIWNIGAEGQYLLGALAATAVGLWIPETPALPSWLIALSAAALSGALWAAIAAWLKLRRGAQEVLTTILLNFTAIQVVAMCVRGPLTDRTSSAGETTADIARAARLPMLSEPFGMHSGLLVAAMLAVACAVLLKWTVWGLRIRIVGGNAIAARFAGLQPARYAAAAFVFSGALAGLAGGIELTGNSYHLTSSFAAGYGYTAIAVAMLARLSPLAIVPSAVFFAMMITGVRGLQYADIPGVEAFPTSLTFVAQGVVVLAVAWTSRSAADGGES